MYTVCVHRPYLGSMVCVWGGGVVVSVCMYLCTYKNLHKGWFQK